MLIRMFPVGRRDGRLAGGRAVTSNVTVTALLTGPAFVGSQSVM